MQTRFQGAAEAFRASLSSTLLLILAAIVTMYIVLGVLYESYIHPITILSTLPSAGVGALLALLISGNELGLIAIIGIILLIGIGDLPGGAAALSADSDDHLGCAVWRDTADAGHRLRR